MWSFLHLLFLPLPSLILTRWLTQPGEVWCVSGQTNSTLPWDPHHQLLFTPNAVTLLLPGAASVPAGLGSHPHWTKHPLPRAAFGDEKLMLKGKQGLCEN